VTHTIDANSHRVTRNLFGSANARNDLREGSLRLDVLKRVDGGIAAASSPFDVIRGVRYGPAVNRGSPSAQASSRAPLRQILRAIASTGDIVAVRPREVRLDAANSSNWVDASAKYFAD
jgi:hypothetical protein